MLSRWGGDEHVLIVQCDRPTEAQRKFSIGAAGRLDNVAARGALPHKGASMTSVTGRRCQLAASCVAAALVVAPCVYLFAKAGTDAKHGNDSDERAWIQLFNGRDLTGWTPKFAKYALGENPFDTVRVENGLLEIRYDKWTKFDGEFGHVFYKDPFSYYLLAAEYRFVGEQVPGGPAWARRNNGLMLHSPAPTTMLKDQDFPISIEVQLLGGLGDGKPRTTANLCTPGTHVVLNGQLHTPHCTNSTSD